MRGVGACAGELRRLGENEDAIVSVIIEKERVQADESNYFVDRTFEGSLPGFLTAFLGGKKLSSEEADEIRKLIDEYSD